MRKLLNVQFDGREEESLTNLIITEDRGYGKEAFTKLVAEFGLGSVFIILDSLVSA